MSDKSTSLSGKESLGKVDATIGTLLPPDIENGSVQMQVGDTQLLEQIGYKQVCVIISGADILTMRGNN